METPFSRPLITPTIGAELAGAKWKDAVEDDAIFKLRSLQKALIDDTNFKLKYTQDVYRWQLLSSQIIFYTVLVVVGIGLALSWMHFRKSFSTPLLGKDQAESEKPTAQSEEEKESSKKNSGPDPSSSELSAFGIKITSSVIGLIILGASIVFLFLYLKFVYPISKI
jgi:cytoskeletal protein RodZ